MARILLIDDDERLRPLLAIILRRAGHDPAEARDGDEGLRLAERETFDLVICDVIMPNREGLETIREMKRRSPDLPVIAISGGMGIAGMDPLPIAARLGAAHTLAKPFRADRLLAAVALALPGGVSLTPGAS